MTAVGNPLANRVEHPKRIRTLTVILFIPLAVQIVGSVGYLAAYGLNLGTAIPILGSAAGVRFAFLAWRAWTTGSANLREMQKALIAYAAIWVFNFLFGLAVYGFDPISQLGVGIFGWAGVMMAQIHKESRPLIPSSTDGAAQATATPHRDQIQQSGTLAALAGSSTQNTARAGDEGFSAAQALREVAALRAAGVVTEEEFQVKKAELLNRI